MITNDVLWRLIGAAALASLTAACASSPPACPVGVPTPTASVAAAAPNYAELESYIRAAMADWNVPGLSIAVVKDDAVVFARGFGVRELGSAEPVDTRTMFGLLSPTKTFAAATLAMLADEGLISLDDRVVDHLPSFRVADPEHTASLRIRDLLSHGTGYEENHRLWYGRGGTRSEVAARASELRAVEEPRTEFHYNNLMYVVAGEVVEAVTGVTWDELVTRRLLEPLGMERTTTTHHPLAGRENVATPHARRFFGFGGIRPIPRFDSANVGPAGSMQSNAAEMTAWLRLHLNQGTFAGRRLLSPEAVREMQRPQVPLPSVDDPRIGGLRAWAPLCGVVDFETLGYGLGWFTMEFRGHRAVMHGGGINGQRSAVGLLPDQGVGVVVFSNVQDTEISLALVYRVFDLFLDAEPRDWSAEFLRVN